MTRQFIRVLPHDFSLSVGDALRSEEGVTNYYVYAPKWIYGFALSDSLSEDLPRHIDLAVDKIVDDILENPVVKKEIDKRLAYARDQGYYKAIQDIQKGAPFS